MVQQPPDGRLNGALPAAGADDEQARAFRRALREFVLQHHPDRGGDPEHFIAGLQRLRERWPEQVIEPLSATDVPTRPAAPVTAYRRGPAPVRVMRGLRRRWDRRYNPRVR